MARTKTFDETLALDKAMHAFWTTGYDGTSIHDLETAMGLSRTSIYNAYGNKRQLFNQVILHYQQTVLMNLLSSVGSEPDIRIAIEKLLSGVIDIHFDKANPGGCLVVLSVLEKEQHEADTIRLLETIIKQVEKFLLRKITEAQKSGQISKKIDTQSASLMIATTAMGTMVMGKANFSKAALRNIIKTTISVLDT